MNAARSSFLSSRLAAVAAVVVSLAALPAVSAAQQPAGGAFPEGFHWGVSTAGFQSEMGRGHDTDPTSDWWAWVHDRGNIASGTASGDLPENGPDFWSKYSADIKLARAGLGADLFRMGLEWSRLFPKRPTNLPSGAATSIEMLRALDRQADPKAVSRYREILKSIRASKMSPFVTLNHFTLPGWIHDPIAVHAALAGRDPNAPLPSLTRAGWLDSATVTEFERYSAWAAWRFGDLVDRWAPINEPMVVATNGYVNIPGVVSGNFPPGVYSFTAAVTAIRNLEAANSVAYAAVKKLDPSSKVGVVQNMIAFTPHDPSSAADVAATAHADYLFNRIFLNAAVRGDFDANADGIITPDERAIHGRSADFVGVNYYFRGRVTAIGASITPQIPVLDFLPATSYRWLLAPLAAPCPTICSDFGSEIYPAGFRQVLKTAGSYKLPVIVTESGVADAKDRLRPAYLRDHFRQMRASITSKEANVIGWLGWSLTDNYEWVSGYAPKFGLYSFNSKTLVRTPRSASVKLVKRAMTTNRVP
ncbi:MAG: glycoside hydrolase family 1 protein [Actinomycetes bacterium]